TGGNDLTADDCGNIPMPVNPTVTKTVSSTAQNPNGTWTVTYHVVVTQPAGPPENPDNLSGLFNLSDTINFGAGITINSASWTGATTGTFPLPGTTATLAANRVIAAGATDTYTITVNATVTRAAVDSTATECDTAQIPSAGGFLNQATLTSDGNTHDVFACDE